MQEEFSVFIYVLARTKSKGALLMFQSKEKDTNCRTNSLNIFDKRIFFLSVLLIIAAAFIQTADAQLSMLHTSGRNIVNASGKVVPLQGVNLGGWLVMEPWMTPADSGGLPDTYSIIQELDTRFGVATEQSMIAAYQKSWITTTDLTNIKNAGFNVVRVPVWWGNFYPIANVSNAAWRSDAFTELDWLVNAAAAQGLYVIIDSMA
jgi:hypothetical protein